MKTPKIYGLRIKGSDSVRYVGVTTKTLAERLRRHINEAENRQREKEMTQ